MNKFAAKNAERQENKSTAKPVADFETFIQSAASDGALTREEPVKVETPVAAPRSLLERRMDELKAVQDKVLETGKKGTIGRTTVSMHREQTIKSEIIKLLIEQEVGMEMSMSQIFTHLVERKFDELVKK